MLLRFNNLTAARFVAALLVFFHHSSPLEYEAMTNPFWKNFANNGHVGVSFFFILSGFVLAASNLDKLGRMTFSGTLSFYWKRIARIVPLWLVVSAPFILKAIETDDPKLIPFLTFTQAWSSDVFVSFGLLAVAWTLSVEIFFYLTFPFIAATVRPFKGRALGPILTLLGLMIPAAGALYYWLNPEMAALFFPDPNSSHRWLYRFPVARLGEFIAGIGVFLTIARCNLPIGRLSSTIGLAATALVLLMVMGTMEKTNTIWIIPYALIFTFMVLMLAQMEKLDLRITWKLPILLGEASFAFYLIHQFYFKAALLPPLTQFSGLAVAQVEVLLAAIATSVGLHLLIEAPARDALLRLLHIRSTMPKVAVTEAVPGETQAKPAL